MQISPVASRYAQAIFEAAKEANQLDETFSQLQEIQDLLKAHPQARVLLGNPDVEPDEKIALLDRVLSSFWSTQVRAFIHVVISMGRSDALEDIVDALRHAVDAERATLRVIVRSARLLPQALQDRLRQSLERREHKQIVLQMEMDPSLIGGLQVVLDHRLIDASIKRQLMELRHSLQTVRVY